MSVAHHLYLTAKLGINYRKKNFMARFTAVDVMLTFVHSRQ